MSSREEIDLNELKQKAIQIEKRINGVDCTNVLSSLTAGTKVSISASQDGCSMETFEGIFVHYSRPTNLITILMDDGVITTYNLKMIFCLSFKFED